MGSGPILVIFDSPGLTNGPSEGVNSVIQHAKAHARDFRTVENMIAIVHLMTDDLEGLPESPYKTIKLSDREMTGQRKSPAAGGCGAAPHSKLHRAQNLPDGARTSPVFWQGSGKIV